MEFPLWIFLDFFFSLFCFCFFFLLDIYPRMVLLSLCLGVCVCGCAQKFFSFFFSRVDISEWIERKMLLSFSRKKSVYWGGEANANPLVSVPSYRYFSLFSLLAAARSSSWFTIVSSSSSSFWDGVRIFGIALFKSRRRRWWWWWRWRRR